MNTIELDSTDDIALADKMKTGRAQIVTELRKRIIGQEDVLDLVLLTLFVGGNSLIIGVPGLAKTLLISTLARTLSLSFSRIQFTPDLMPSDITGTDVIEEDKATGQRQLRFVKGPVFANIILADEINRTPPKTQAALLEAMQEHQVTAGGFLHKLPEPFFVLATQNPIEQEGTYPLPEAQLDRFMFKSLIDYPAEEEEFRIIKLTTAPHQAEVQHVLAGDDILEIQHIVRKVPCADHVIRYAMRLVRSTRREKGEVPAFVQDYITWGAGPRASQYLVLAAKARAILQGRYFVSTEDIREMALPVMRHRIITNFNAEAESIKTDTLIEWLIRDVPVGESGELDEVGAEKAFAKS